MCLGVPGRITEVKDRWGFRLARVASRGGSREVCQAFVTEAAAREHCTGHMRLAISLQSVEPESLLFASERAAT